MTLEEEIPCLTMLDEYRKEARRMLDDTEEIIESLAQSEWSGSNDSIEYALIARAQKTILIPQLVKERLLSENMLERMLASEENARGAELLPTLNAARVMQALVRTSELAFDSVTLQCYYCIVRELYSASGPDWNMGGARAGSTGRATAFVTGECVRAISAFKDSLLRTATYFAESHRLKEAWEKLQDFDCIDYWKERECERLALAWYAKTDVQLGGIALNLELKTKLKKGYASNYIRGEISKLEGGLVIEFSKSKSRFEHALRNIDASRAKEKERSGENPTRFDMQESGHRVARGAVVKAIRQAEDALKHCPQSPDSGHAVDLLGLESLFRRAARNVRRILRPAKRFLETVLDHELAAASTQGARLVDVPELAFSAASFGAATGWKDERLDRACSLLGQSISEHGEFPVGRPIHATEEAFRLDPVGFEVARACSQLWEHIERPADEKFFGRMLQIFTGLSVPKRTGAIHRIKTRGWTFEHLRSSDKPVKWATALAVLSLRRYTRMLDAVINRTVLKHFDYTVPSLGDINLEKIMHTDVGLEALEPERKPIQVLLEQLRTHVLGSRLPHAFMERVFSVVLFGPPGTGKTTLLSALAASCRVPLVNVSPSDFTVGGQEGVERRARAVCGALSLLSSAVIVLDEFEPILQARQRSKVSPVVGVGELELNHSAQEPRSLMLSFLTPSMLPKLTRLYERAKKQRVVYGLLTNHYEQLDAAAIREKRFDLHLIVLRPDPISREVFLVRGLLDSEGFVGNKEQWERIGELLQLTSGRSVQFLAKGLQGSGTLARYIITGEEMFNREKLKADGREARRLIAKENDEGCEPIQKGLLDWENEIVGGKSLTSWLRSRSGTAWEAASCGRGGDTQLGPRKE